MFVKKLNLQLVFNDIIKKSHRSEAPVSMGIVRSVSKYLKVGPYYLHKATRQLVQSNFP